MRVELVWSMDAGRYACLHIPHGVTLPEFAELERAVLLQLSAVRKSLEAEQSASQDPTGAPTDG